MSLLSVKNVTVSYNVRAEKSNFFSFFEKKEKLIAVRDLSFCLEQGQILGIVGESGCGKTTLTKAIMGEVAISGGKILFDRQPINAYSRQERAKNIQLIFQSSIAAMDPKMSAFEIIAEPLNLISEKKLNRADLEKKVLEMLKLVGLPQHFLSAMPLQFSGGEAQRVAIARALIVRPKLLICDEPVSALDVSIQAKIINLLKSLNKRFKLSIIFISHNLLVVRQIADHILVMYAGEKMEFGPAQKILMTPRHPYTSALWASTPLPHFGLGQKSSEFLAKDADLALTPSKNRVGCPFYNRCQFATQACYAEYKVDQSIFDHECACLRAEALKEKLWRPNFSS